MYVPALFACAAVAALSLAPAAAVAQNAGGYVAPAIASPPPFQPATPNAVPPPQPLPNVGSPFSATPGVVNPIIPRKSATKK